MDGNQIHKGVQFGVSINSFRREEKCILAAFDHLTDFLQLELVSMGLVRLLMPPSSSILNPIEGLWNVFKGKLKKWNLEQAYKGVNVIESDLQAEASNILDQIPL